MDTRLQYALRSTKEVGARPSPLVLYKAAGVTRGRKSKRGELHWHVLALLYCQSSVRLLLEVQATAAVVSQIDSMRYRHSAPVLTGLCHVVISPAGNASLNLLPKINLCFSSRVPSIPQRLASHLELLSPLCLSHFSLVTRGLACSRRNTLCPQCTVQQPTCSSSRTSFVGIAIGLSLQHHLDNGI